MAYTGKKHKGSKILTPETVENHEKLYKWLGEIEESDPTSAGRLKEMMFEKMFYALSHSAQREILEWARNANFKVIVMGEKI